MSENKLIKIIKCLLTLSLLICTVGCSSNSNETINSDSDNMSNKHRIIIDSDCGGDDALAIMMALEAENIDVEGIVTISGNVPLEQAAKNALMCVELSGQDVPVYYGSNTNYCGEEKELFSVFGEDGMGDANLINPSLKVEDEEGVDFILQTIKDNPYEIDIVTLGPVTDIAKALDKDPETMSLAKSIIVMGTSGFGAGNATPVAEFNVYSDAEAFERVIESEIPMTVISLDVCEDGNLIFNAEQIEEWKKDGGIKEFLAISWNKIFDYYVGNGLDYVMICDAVAMYTLIYDDAIISSIQCAGVCVTGESPAYGEVILYKQGVTYDSMPDIKIYPISVVNTIDSNDYHQRLNDLLK